MARPFLANFASIEGHTNYLRVITRVYLAGKLNVSLQSSRTRGGEIGGGARKPVDLILPQAGSDPQKTTMDDYKKRVDELNTMIEKALKKSSENAVEKLLPGGTIKVVAASARTVSLSETFSRPLVIGYLGFDMAILTGGILGPPMPTYAVLQGNVRPVQVTRPTAPHICKNIDGQVIPCTGMCTSGFNCDFPAPCVNGKLSKTVLVLPGSTCQ